MDLPRWVVVLIGCAVSLFGAYRVSLSRKDKRPATYLGSKTADLVMGLVHFLSGIALVLFGMGLFR